MAVATNSRPITRDDLQAAYTQLLGEGEATARSAMPQVVVIVGAVALVAVAIAFTAGRRRGRRQASVIVRRA
jgi:hypothetical protein